MPVAFVAYQTIAHHSADIKGVWKHIYAKLLNTVEC